MGEITVSLFCSCLSLYYLFPLVKHLGLLVVLNKPTLHVLLRFEGQISGKNIEIGIIGNDRKFRQVTDVLFNKHAHN